jgi:hypothetical protein
MYQRIPWELVADPLGSVEHNLGILQGNIGYAIAPQWYVIPTTPILFFHISSILAVKFCRSAYPVVTQAMESEANHVYCLSRLIKN